MGVGYCINICGKHSEKNTGIALFCSKNWIPPHLGSMFFGWSHFECG